MHQEINHNKIEAEVDKKKKNKAQKLPRNIKINLVESRHERNVK